MRRKFYTGSLGSLKEFWEDKGRTGSFEEDYNIRLEGVSQIVKRVEEVLHGKLVLDIGCGPGIVSSLLPKNTQMRLVGLDFSISMLKSAKSRIQKLVQGSAFNLPFLDGTFGAAICFFVASDYHDKCGIFSEVHRVLKKDGFFFFADYSLDDEHWMLKKKIRPLIGERCDIFIESEESISNKMRQAGFKIWKTEIIVFNPTFDLRRYVNSGEEMRRLKETDLNLWREVRRRIDDGKMRREFLLITSQK